MDHRLDGPNQPLTVSILRGTLEKLEAAGHGNTPISLYAPAARHLIQAYNVNPDTSTADRPHAPALGFCSTWDVTKQTDTITNFVIL